MARPKSNGSPNASTATIGFEATALRDSAILQGVATLRSLSNAKDNLWLTADTALRDSAFLHSGGKLQVMTERQDNLRNNMDAAETSGASKTAAGSPKGERGGAHQYFLTRFASAEGKNGGQFYTPSCAVRCLVEMLASYKGRIYDPACGSGGMFVQSEKFVESHGGVAKCEVRSASVEVKTSRPSVMANSVFDARSSEQELRQKLTLESNVTRKD